MESRQFGELSDVLKVREALVRPLIHSAISVGLAALVSGRKHLLLGNDRRQTFGLDQVEQLERWKCKVCEGGVGPQDHRRRYRKLDEIASSNPV